MLASGIPSKFSLVWAVNASGTFTRAIPATQTNGFGSACLSIGFPPENFSAVGAGGIPPAGADFNGIINQMTAWHQWYQAGATVPVDPTFSTAIGGYPQGAIIRSAVSPTN